MLVSYLPAVAQDEGTVDMVETTDSVVMSGSHMSKVSSAALTELDVNGDGVLNVADIVDIVRYVRGSARTAFQKDKADFNGDGVVDLEDARLLSIGLTGGEMPSAATRPSDNPTVMRGDSVADPEGPK